METSSGKKGHRNHLPLTIINPFAHSKPPILYPRMFTAHSRVPCLLNFFLRYRDCRTVKVIPRRNAQDVEERRRKISMRSHHTIRRIISRNPRSAHDQGHVDVLLVPAALARLQPVLADMEAVVAAIHHIGIIKEVVFLETRDKPLDKFIDALECTQTLPVEVVVVLHVSVILLRQRGDPVRARGLVRVEIRRPRHRHVLEKVLVPLCGHRLREVDGVYVRPGRPVHDNVSVRCDGRGDEEERLSRVDGLV